MDLSKHSVRELAISNPTAIDVFEEFHLDYCCNGHRKLIDACTSANVDLLKVLTRLEDLPEIQEVSRGRLAEFLEAGELVDYLICNHHTFTRDAIGRIDMLFETVLRECEPDHVSLTEIAVPYNALKIDLTTHMQKEEFLLFPYIKELSDMQSSKGPPSLHSTGTIQIPVRQLMDDHEMTSIRLQDLRAATNNYTIPSDACVSYQALLAGLLELETDLHRHMHLENNVLFPMTITLEQQILFGIPQPSG